MLGNARGKEIRENNNMAELINLCLNKQSSLILVQFRFSAQQLDCGLIAFKTSLFKINF